MIDLLQQHDERHTGSCLWPFSNCFVANRDSTRDWYKQWSLCATLEFPPIFAIQPLRSRPRTEIIRLTTAACC